MGPQLPPDVPGQWKCSSVWTVLIQDHVPARPPKAVERFWDASCRWNEASKVLLSHFVCHELVGCQKKHSLRTYVQYLYWPKSVAQVPPRVWVVLFQVNFCTKIVL